MDKETLHQNLEKLWNNEETNLDEETKNYSFYHWKFMADKLLEIIKDVPTSAIEELNELTMRQANERLLKVLKILFQINKTGIIKDNDGIYPLMNSNDKNSSFSGMMFLMLFLFAMSNWNSEGEKEE